MEALSEILSKIQKLEQAIQIQSAVWLDIDQASEYLHLSKSKLYKLIAAEKIPFRRIGEGKNAKILFSRRSLDLWIITGKPGGYTKQDRQRAEIWL